MMEEDFLNDIEKTGRFMLSELLRSGRTESKIHMLSKQLSVSIKQ